MFTDQSVDILKKIGLRSEKNKMPCKLINLSQARESQGSAIAYIYINIILRSIYSKSFTKSAGPQ